MENISFCCIMAVEGEKKMESNQLNTKIINYLEKSLSPMTAVSMSHDLNESLNNIERALGELEVGNLVEKIIPKNKNSNRIYYAVKRNSFNGIDEKNVSNNEKAVNAVKSAIAQETVDVKDGYEDLSEKIERVDKNVNGLYANIISIMSIFVAIFALITVNANIVFKLTQEDMQAVFLGIITINVFVVICILALLMGVRRIIINPLIGKK